MRTSHGIAGAGKFIALLAAGSCSGFLLFLAIFNGLDLGAALESLHRGDLMAPVLAWALGFALCAFVAGMASGDYSWVDRLWSVLPVFFAWYYAWRGGFGLPILLAAALVTVWGIRLTWNFAKKGGYSGSEDYRWSILRAKLRNPLAWQAFNLGFISLFQIGMFVLFTAPMAKLARGASIGSGHPIFFCAGLALMLFAILWEAKADAQQWEFQEAKRCKKEGGVAPGEFEDDVARGFRTTGFFSLSRHPNYFGELLTWIALYLAASAWTGSFLDWSLAGPVLLCALFAGSTVFTEGISASKYPEYAEYRKRVSAIIPWKKR
jgi:steroid 5-alpha reductase family enzyme